MTFYELEIANRLKQEITDIESLTRGLRLSISNHEKNSKCMGYRRFFRFVNCKLQTDEETKARIFLFDGLGSRGIEIPVDQEICEKVLKIFEEKLEDKQREFKAIGSNGNE